MDSGENKHDAEYNVSTEKTNVDSSTSGTGYQPRKSRTRLIIIGVVAAVIVLAVVIVVVVVVVTRTKNVDEEAEKETTTIEDETTGCGPFNVTYSDKAPTFIVSSGSLFYMTGCKISGNCWTRKQCYDCLEGPNRDRVGNLNHIPVCCPDCGRYGLSLSWSSCNCNNHGL
ncbi:uncharacterized protein LOC123566183 isoform X1 [Mercenaria mercenaria]|uniref:uncharacterized protein LOC128547313 n=1 Tax=Mercenaria mercenaria TaxID=6596 RepID=UPI00234ED5D2|nr:uncharacterized protein LOC128547313 [Mercenaria mercenaria]XP_053375618.1 uncharacterized protein LOC128547313 [Mercenaria mercenaria]XP_053375619.1 uncharacterized protein LOC128547313 [Mercenaria mercenaria]XP_053375620.1 uncharacterized protein LOC128547313 [Mercenaria mercenaria]XP_053375645.1 uncharacterized protein LOC123566183 isoform X1 [Mercenaria mercenaria]XP_053375646.1 uncharacterized protein LOC123566183 isoform X1 [Mercenaria mercenaria]XP_053375647.1 uncharacterized protei